MKANLGISTENRLSVSNKLAKLMADENLLYIKTKNAHWNIEGSDFYEKHKFFQTQIGEIDAIIDRVAERIRTLGHYARGTLQSFLDLTHLIEKSREKNDSLGFIKELISDHESIIMKLRENIKPFAEDFKDVGSSDFITGLMEEHEKMAWFLRSHLN